MTRFNEKILVDNEKYISLKFYITEIFKIALENICARITFKVILICKKKKKKLESLILKWILIIILIFLDK